MITKFNEFINEKLDNVLFPHGGNIGGEHKKPIKDKDFKPKPTGIRNEVSYSIGKEKKENRLKNLIGKVLTYDEMTDIEFIIEESERYLKSTHENDKKYRFYNIKYRLNILPDVIEHFNIDTISDDSIIDFIVNKLDLFKRSYIMYKEEYNKRYEDRYNESKK